VQLVRPEATERGIGVRLECADGIGPLRGDRVQLQQVVLNLLHNAVEAIVERPGAIAVRIAPDHEGVRVSISDSGAGVPPEVIDRIFTPFFSTKDSGLGMGLSISRTIVEAHGGRLWMESSTGGTTFSFTLPVRRG
jgi:signal transduction histidine kinase